MSLKHMISRYSLMVFLICNLTCPDLSRAVMVVDSFHRQISIETPPERIACLYAFSGHVVTMLGRGADMVAIVNGLKKDVLINQINPGIKNISTPFKGGVIHIESLLKTKPDIIFLKPETAVVGAEIEKLNRFSLPYFVAGYRSMSQQMQVIENIGKAIGRYPEALEYTQYYTAVVKRVENRIKKIPEDKKIKLYHSVNEPTRTDAPNTLEADWTKAAGVINVSVGTALKGKGEKHFADIEQILLWNPDVIIVNEDGVDQQILTDKKWEPIRAVQDKKVFAVPVGISRWGHPGGLETPLAILWTAKKVYPDYFTDLDLIAEIKLFYKQFFDMELTKQMVNKILSNKGMRHTIK